MENVRFQLLPALLEDVESELSGFLLAFLDGVGIFVVLLVSSLPEADGAEPTFDNKNLARLMVADSARDSEGETCIMPVECPMMIGSDVKTRGSTCKAGKLECGD